ncbi:MAG: NADH-specific methylglyoxal reductase [Candidatus Moanabacter tarae]|uniref:NADH-specific methylglyoxal reductase n=1 Tax=Candidatus Moanibacter tarae TaxID=2200854 RepID=A0A2Z4AJN6_9BACT|nr:MAG: NADH-specific methylglyoxal reductase [Candidatus Moanabacter tarae]
MIYRTLGRTGLEMPIMGMGSGGGTDPLGQVSGKPEREIHALLHRAYDLGINFFDTSPGYMESEAILGRALNLIPREELILSTKIPLIGLASDNSLQIMHSDAIRESVDRSLSRLQTEYIDIMLIAVASLECLDVVINDQLPILQDLQQAGKIRFLGSSELSRSDGSHEWLKLLLPTNLIDVAMVAHNMINQSAQKTVFPFCVEHNIGVINVFTVRRAFGVPGRLKEILADLLRLNVVSEKDITLQSPLQFLLEGDVGSLIEASYRYAAYTPGVTTVMNGATEVLWLEENVRNIQKGPLPEKKLQRLKKIFARVSEPIGN